jgi:hypothetical protein
MTDQIEYLRALVECVEAIRPQTPDFEMTDFEMTPDSDNEPPSMAKHYASGIVAGLWLAAGYLAAALFFVNP